MIDLIVNNVSSSIWTVWKCSSLSKNLDNLFLMKIPTISFVGASTNIDFPFPRKRTIDSIFTI